MRQNAKSTFKLSLITMLAVASVIGCTKKKELQDNVGTDAYISKSEINGKKFYLSRGIEEADSDNPLYAVPGFSQDMGIVEARITQNELQLISVFAPNGRPETNTIVASFPITGHFDIKREENDFKEQTHKIVEDTEKPWDQRQFMRVNWANPSNHEGKFGTMLSGQGVSISEENTTLVENAKIENGAISWLVETGIKAGASEAEEALGYGSLPTFRVRHRTFLMPVKTTGFPAVEYSLTDFSRFGMFYTQQNWLDPEKGLRESGVKRYANVFNVCEAGNSNPCSTKQIKWVLTKNFPEKYLQETRKAVEEWNNAFKAALNRTDDVVILDESQQVEISDPRFNVIAHYEPRAGGGLLGVAQGVEDPETGEKISARATVYEDGIRSVVGQVDELIELLATDDPLRDFIKTEALGTAQTYESPFGSAAAARSFRAAYAEKQNFLGVNKVRPSRSQGTVRNVRESFQNAANTNGFSRTRTVALAQKFNTRRAQLVAQVPELFQLADLTEIRAGVDRDSIPTPSVRALHSQLPSLNGVEELLFIGRQLRAQRADTLESARRGIHGAEFAEEAAVRYLLRLLKNGTDPKALKAQKEAIKAEIAKQTYYSTLLHEMGHTFGLRHNFAASSDKAHYQDRHKEIETQLKTDQSALKPEDRLTADDLEPHAYSSIMDYGADFYSQTNGLGAYDRAAIKYAYNRSINRNSDAVTLAGFKFCTDHQVGETINCRRFDAGSNVSEITANTIENFQANWARTHYRRGRVWSQRAPIRLAGRFLETTMIPVRQVFDELIYSIIAGEELPPEQRTGSLCDFRFVKASIDAGEMSNICDPLTAERAGVDVTDMSTLPNALFNPETGELRKSPREYLSYGMADLLFANMLAQQFFQDVIGSGEPGTYLAMPPQNPGESFTLRRLSTEAQGDEAKLRAFAENEGVDNVDAFVNQAKNFVTEVRIGRVGKPFSTTLSFEAGFPKVENVGSFYDKYAAIIALSARDIGIMKYTDIVSLAGNAYSFPQSKSFATRIFDRLITNNQNITMVPVTLRSGREVSAGIQASLSADLQGLSTMFAFTDMVSETDTSMIDKLRVCNANDAQCAGSSGGAVVEFRSSSGGDVFRAAQTFEQDSIAFSLVTQAKATADEAKIWLDLVQNPGGSQADALMKLDNAEPLRARIDENLARIPELAALRPGLIANGRGARSAWAMVGVLTREVQTAPTFEVLNLANQIMQAFGQAGAQVDAQIARMGNAGICETATPRAPTAADRDMAARLRMLDNVVRVDALGGESPAAGTPATVDSAPGPIAANNGGARPNNGVQPPTPPVVVDPCTLLPVSIRRAALEQLKADMTEITNLVAEVLDSGAKTKIAPIRYRQIDQDLRSQESHIRLMRRFMRLINAE